jgi:hypothetical protein
MQKKTIIVLLVMISSLALSACGGQPEPIPTLDVALIQTLAVGTFQAGCYNLSYVKDVTIPDNTPVTPGQSFTKTWLVSNSGSCAWEVGFIFNVVGGEAMSGAAVTLNQKVEPGRQFEFSVPMVAPTDKTGELKGTWRLSDANGNFFGDGVYVLVIVGNATPAATATETPIPTP